MCRSGVLLLFLSFRIFADEAAPLREALKKQAAHKSVVATFRQTKKVPALTNDIKTMGKLFAGSLEHQSGRRSFTTELKS
jgi:hypothetical protein